MSTNSTAPTPDFQTAKDCRSAIAVVEDSTRAFESHIEATRKVEYSNFNAAENTPRIAEPRALRQQQQQSKLIDSLRQDIQDHHRTSSESLQTAIASNLIVIDDTVSRHDHKFDLLENYQSPSFGATISFDNSDRTQKLLLALQKTLAEAIKTRLNRTYLEALQINNLDINGYNGHLRSPADSDIELVEADLKALHAEINDVAQMLVSHEHGEVLAAVNLSLGEARSSLQEQHTRHTAEQIANMTHQLEMIIERAEALQSHRLALQRLANHLQDNNTAQTAQRLVESNRVSTGRPKKDMPSLAALQQYLGLAHASAARLAKSEQIGLAFDDFMSHTSSSLAIQDEQTGIVRCATITSNIEKDYDDHSIENMGQASSLDNLDSEIAEVKARMDAFSP